MWKLKYMLGKQSKQKQQNNMNSINAVSPFEVKQLWYIFIFFWWYAPTNINRKEESSLISSHLFLLVQLGLWLAVIFSVNRGGKIMSENYIYNL